MELDPDDVAQKHPALSHRYITTYSGQKIASRLITPEQVVRSDISRSIAMQCRYLGHVRNFYSVAEHSVLVSELAESAGEPSDVVIAALLHDAHEAYTGDFPSPYKYDVEGLRDWENHVENVVKIALGQKPVGHPIWSQVKVYDVRALHFEASMLMVCDPGWVDKSLLSLVPAHLTIWANDWHTAMFHFQRRAQALGLTGF